MMRTGLILVSSQGICPQLVNCAVVILPSSIYYSVGVHVVRDVIRKLITFLL